MFVRRTSLLLVAVAALAGVSRVGAQTAVSNLGQAASGSNLWIGVNATPLTEHDVFSFTTGASAANFDFTGISLNFASAATGGGGPASGLTLGLYSGFNPSSNAGTASQLASLTLVSGDPTVAGTYAFSGSASLAANTTYYLAVSADTSPAGSFYQLGSTASYSETASLTGWTIQNGLYNWNQGSSNWSLYSGLVPQFSVQASETAVPEPSAYAALAGLGALGFVALRRRRRSGPHVPA